MQDYGDIAKKNGVTLIKKGSCQFCGANTSRGIHECIEIFSLGFQQIDYSDPKDHIFRFIMVDAHTLQHPEIHGRWNNHFHLSRQHLIFHYELHWTYELSTKLSETLNDYKKNRTSEVLVPPPVSKRGKITITSIQKNSTNKQECKEMILKWGKEVYYAWNNYHEVVDLIAQKFIAKRHLKL